MNNRPGSIIHWRYNSISTIIMSKSCFFVNADIAGLPTSLRQKHCVDILWLVLCSGQDPTAALVFPHLCKGYFWFTVQAILDSLSSQTTVLAGQGGLFALAPLNGCRVHPLHLSMPSSGSAKICSFQNYCSVFKAGFSLEGLHFQAELQTWSVHIFQCWLESPWIWFFYTECPQGQGIVQQFWNLDWIRKCP